MRATVVGAGVAGLTTAAALAETGWSVDIVAAQPFEDVVSVVAAAVWTTTAAEPAERARRWAAASWDRFDQFADAGDRGVRRLKQIEYERVDPGPGYWETTRYCRRLKADELPDGYAAGFEVDGFNIEPPIYLRWLRASVEAAGARITTGEVDDLSAVGGDLVVNCTGLGAQHLTGDRSMYPIRGQTVLVTNPGVDDAHADESDINRIAYVYPRSTAIVLGGVRESGNSDLAPDDETTARILADCAALDPRVADLDVVEVRVGLRPGRPEVRVELDALSDGRPLIHNYGHSGAGFLLSWGCAGDVVSLAASAEADS